MSEKVAASKVVEKAAQGSTLVKLLIFAVSMAVAPLATYYGSLNYYWNGDSTFAAFSAVFAANVVLVTYIGFAMYEDGQFDEFINRNKNKEASTESRKNR